MTDARTTRRRFLHTAALTATAAHLLPHSLLAQQTSPVQSSPVQSTPVAPPTAAPPPDRLTQMRAAGASAKITTHPLRGNVSALLGSGGNIAVLTGAPGAPKSDGKLLIDSGFSTSRPQIAEALAAINADPLTHLIDTHWHFDHTDGNGWMHTAGATIIAHENTKKRLSTDQRIAAFGMTVPASPAGALPTVVFSEDHTLALNGETLHLTHYAPAHTDTDISVYFANADILHVGDTWFNGIYPFIDYSTGGNIDGMVAAAKRNLSTATAKTIIIPGHGPIGDRAQLQQFHDMLSGVRETVATLKRQGRSIDDIIAAKPTAPFDSNFKAALGPVGSFIRLVFQGV